MKNVAIGEVYRYVAIRVSGRVVVQDHRCFIEAERSVACEYLGGNRASGRRWKSEVPACYARARGEMFARVLMGENRGARSMQPFIAVGVVEVPMRVDEMLDRVGANASQGLGDLGTRTSKTGVDEELTVASRKNGDISSRAKENTHVSTEALNADGGSCRSIAGLLDQAGRGDLILSEDPPGSEEGRAG